MSQTQRAARRAEDVVRLLDGTPYRLVRALGRGAIGEVYEIEHTFLGRRLALKVLHAVAADGVSADRMRVEAQVLGRIRHPGVVDVIDFWTAPNGRPCIVMELLEGRTLAERFEGHAQLAEPDVVDLGVQALSALAAAHALGIVHRDLKPENLFLHAPEGRKPVLKILDFGLVRVLPTSGPETAPVLAIRTKTGALVGSPRYMSPEALRGERVDARADLYSLGIILYVALTGTGPFDEEAGPPVPPSALRPDGLSPAMDALVLHAIATHMDDRFQSAEEFLGELTRLQVPTR